MLASVNVPSLALLFLVGACVFRPPIQMEDSGQDDDDNSDDDNSDEIGESSNALDLPSWTIPDVPPQVPDDCNVLAQDCPEEYKCVPDAYGDHVCVPLLGMKHAGEPCLLQEDSEGIWTDECGPALACWNDVCTPLCMGESEESAVCPPGFECLPTGNFLGLCAGVSCNPLDAEPCPSGWPCMGLGSTAACEFAEGAGHGPVLLGEECEADFVCNPDSTCCQEGLTCELQMLLPDCPHSGCCTAWCDSSNPEACIDQPGTECNVAFNNEYGVCL